MVLKSHSTHWAIAWLPITSWLPTYPRDWLGPDLVSGITLAAFCVPVAMAYASPAGLPPQAGLYASILAPIAYVLFGTSRQLAIGPTSSISILVAFGAGASGLVRDRLRAPGLRDRFGVLGPDTTISAVLRDWQQAGEQL
jgi:MFS superfamily sulfate permease-like transporter